MKVLFERVSDPMSTASKKVQKLDLEKIAAQLGKVHITPVPGEDHHALRATATFTTRSFSVGLYKVSIGIRFALLHLLHPGYEIEHAYQATLAKETWSESWKLSSTSQLGGGVEIKLGARILEAIGISLKGTAEKARKQTAESRASSPYPIVAASPKGWQIGTELGDPRDPQGVLPGGLEHCLNGEYLSGRNGESGDGFKEKNGRMALCELIVKTSANDPHITATLFGSADSLKVAVVRLSSSEPAKNNLATKNEEKDHEDALRSAFIEICIQRAKDALKDGARTDDLLSGDFYLNHHEIVGPRTPTPVIAGIMKSERDEQAAIVKQKLSSSTKPRTE
jgi:hypothetical protein